MKLPVIRLIQRECSSDEIGVAIKVLEKISEAPGMKDEELDVIGEMISNLCGAQEVHEMIAGGMAEKDAANAFMKKVVGSIDR